MVQGASLARGRWRGTSIGVRTSAWALPSAAPGPGADKAIGVQWMRAAALINVVMLWMLMVNMIGAWVAMVVPFVVTMNLAVDSADAGTLTQGVRGDLLATTLHKPRASAARAVRQEVRMRTAA